MLLIKRRHGKNKSNMQQKKITAKRLPKQEWIEQGFIDEKVDVPAGMTEKRIFEVGNQKTLQGERCYHLGSLLYYR